MFKKGKCAAGLISLLSLADYERNVHRLEPPLEFPQALRAPPLTRCVLMAKPKKEKKSKDKNALGDSERCDFDANKYKAN